MAKKYLKNSEGIVRAVTSDNLGLEKPLLNENYNIEVHNRNMDKIDNAIQEVKGKIDINKGDILNLNNRADNLNTHIGNLISTDNVLMNNGYVVRKHCHNADALNINNGVFATGEDTVGINRIGILTHKQWDVNYAYQTFHPHGVTYLMFRHKQSNAWSEWREL